MYFKLLLLLILIYVPFLSSQPPKKKPNPYVNPATMTMDTDGHEDCIGKIERREQHERKLHWAQYYHDKYTGNKQQKKTREKFIIAIAQKAVQLKAQQSASEK